MPPGVAIPFSRWVSLILLVANIMRLGYWFYARFMWPLVAQSLLMIALQVEMMRQVVRIRRESIEKIVAGRDPESLFDEEDEALLDDVNTFWKWLTIWPYIGILCGFALFIAAFTALDRNVLHLTISEDLLGIGALSLESGLALPQVVRNFRRRATHGLALGMLIGWLLGDIAKTAYYWSQETPWVFLACGAIQMVVDGVLLMQVIWYNRMTIFGHTLTVEVIPEITISKADDEEPIQTVAEDEHNKNFIKDGCK